MPPPKRPSLANDEYHIGWICALPTELTAARAMLDEIHGSPQTQSPSDNNNYCLGRIDKHAIVIACLPDYGTTSAAVVAEQMLHSFKQIRIGLMVGIGGGVPSSNNDIRLGDVVVSKPQATSGGVIQYDLGKSKPGGTFERTGSLNRPPQVLLTALSTLQSTHEMEDSKVCDYLSEMNKHYPKLKPKYSRPESQHDHLYNENYNHIDNAATCENCDRSQLVIRRPREQQGPAIHYGLIASGNQVVKNAATRSEMGRQLGVLCLEMEAAGLMNHFPCLVVRGICDYADSHKNKEWQPYAAATAAAFAKELLQLLPIQAVILEQPIISVADNTLHKLVAETNALHIQEASKNDLRYEDEASRKCHQLLRAARYETQKEQTPNAVDGTCQWVLNNEIYRTWHANNHNSLLWISADPGCGKSVLSKLIIDKQIPSNENDSTLYFFFKDNEEQNRVDIALCSLLHQLFVYKPHLLQHAVKMWKRDGDILKEQVASLWCILEAATADPRAGNIVCVLDALDECQHEQKLGLINKLKQFHSLVTDGTATRTSTWKILVTSRPYDEIERGFHRPTNGVPIVRIAGEDQNPALSKEIDLVIRSQMSDIATELQLAAEVKQSLEANLLKFEHRTYLWLYLVIEEIRNSLKRTEKRLAAIISAIPCSLDEAYEKILDKSTDIEETKILLDIILTSTRPLTLEEIDIALALAGDDQCATVSELDLDGPNTQRRVRNLCGLFIYIGADHRIYFIHQTAKEFLNLRRISSNTGKKSWLKSSSEEEANHLMAQICIRYLHLAELKEKLGQTPDTYDVFDRRKRQRAVAGQFTLFEYAKNNWAKHFSKAHCDPSESLSRLAAELCGSSFRELWHDTYATCGLPVSPDWSKFPNSSLHIGAYLGLEVVVRCNIEVENRPADPPFGFNRTPLYYAISRDHIDVARYLLGRKDIFAGHQDARGWTPLILATERGYEDMLQLLLTRDDANVNCADIDGNTPLLIATEDRRVPLMKLLLADSRVDRAWTNKKGMTALIKAIANRSIAAVSVLLTVPEIGLNLKDKNGRTALWWAAHLAVEELVTKLLQRKDINVNCTDIEGRTPLAVAISKKSLPIVDLLLGRDDTDVNLKNNAGQAPITIAVQTKDEDILRSLLRRSDCIVESKDKSGNTPMSIVKKLKLGKITRILQDRIAGIV